MLKAAQKFQEYSFPDQAVAWGKKTQQWPKGFKQILDAGDMLAVIVGYWNPWNYVSRVG